MKKVYIVCYDIPFEGIDILKIFFDSKKALEYKKTLKSIHNISIYEYEVE